MTFKKTTTLKRKYTLFFFFHSYTLNVSFIQKNKKTIFTIRNCTCKYSKPKNKVFNRSANYLVNMSELNWP